MRESIGIDDLTDPDVTHPGRQTDDPADRSCYTIIQPLSDRVVILPDEKISRTKGGILLPDKAQDRPMTGKIIACGPGALNEQGTLNLMQVKVGDVVLFSRYAGNEFEAQGTTYSIMRESDVMAVLKQAT